MAWTFPTWINGRQGSGYRRLTLIESNRFKFDIHILRMPTGAHIPEHIDPIPQAFKDEGYISHHRLNIVLRRAFGGIFASNKLGEQKTRIIRFRPDIDKHWVTKVTSGTRYVLSIGWLSK